MSRAQILTDKGFFIFAVLADFYLKIVHICLYRAYYFFTFFPIPMKKNLFVLFSLYFFVVQPIFVWLLRQEPNMLILGLINLVAILIILLISKGIGGKDDKTHKEIHHKEAHAQKEPIHEDKETLFQAHHHEPIIKKSPKKGGFWKGLIGVIIGVVVYILCMGSAFGYKLIIASLVALILLFLICLFTRSVKRYFALAGTKVLLLFLALGIIIF